MSKVGKLKTARPNDLSRLTGQIQTFDATFNVRLEGDESLCDAQQPSHRIYTRNRMGSEIEIGSAWLKTAQKGERAGERFMTLSIDYPGLSVPLNVVSFPSGDDGDWTVSWRRRGSQPGSAANA